MPRRPGPGYEWVDGYWYAVDGHYDGRWYGIREDGLEGSSLWAPESAWGHDWKSEFWTNIGGKFKIHEVYSDNESDGKFVAKSLAGDKNSQ